MEMKKKIELIEHIEIKINNFTVLDYCKELR